MTTDPLFTPLPDDGVPVVTALPEEALEGLGPGQQAEVRAQHLLGGVLPQSWLFPPTRIDGAAVFLFARHDIEPGGDGGDPAVELRVSAPIGRITVVGDDATIDWEPGMAPGEITEATVPPADRPVIADPLLARPGYEQHALSEELRALAVIAAGGEPHDDVRLGRLFPAVVPEWLVERYRELGADLGPPPRAAAPRIDAAFVPRTFADGLGVPDAGVFCLVGNLVAAAEQLGLEVSPSSPLAGVPAVVADDLDLDPGLVASLARPDFLVSMRGLAGGGRVDVDVAIASIDGVTHWTGLSTVDDAVIVMPGVDAAALAEWIVVALDVADLDPAPMLILPVDAARMMAVAAVADAHGSLGAAAFGLAPSELQRWIDSPSPTGLSAVFAALATMPRPALVDGFGHPEFFGVTDGEVVMDAMVRTYARRLRDVRGHVAVTLTDLTGPGGTIISGHGFFTADGHLWTATPEGGWTPEGVDAAQRVDLATLDPGEMTRLIGVLLGDDPGERPQPE